MSFPIIQPLIAAVIRQRQPHADAFSVVRVANRDRQRVGGVLAIEHRLRQQHFHHHGDLRLVAMADTDHRLLDRVGRVFGDSNPARAGTSMAMPRAWPSFNVAAASLLTKVCLDRRFVRRMSRRSPRQSPS